jgi:predicted Zn-dependent protease
MNRAPTRRWLRRGLVLCALLTFQKQSGLRAQSAGDSLAQPNQQPANQESALSRAMRDELSRSKKDLRLAQLESPYFISYQIREIQDVGISASSGSLLASGENRSRMLTVELRVGDYALDNTNFFAGPEFAFTRNRSFFGFNELPLDDNYLEFRRVIWLATDSAYKQALEKLAGKHAALQNRTRTENLPDFSKEEPTRTSDVLPSEKFQRSAAESLVRDLSKILGNVPDLYNSSVALSASYLRTLYLNSEGTSYEITEPLVTLAASASTQAVDGMPLDESVDYYARSLASLPAPDELADRIRDMTVRLENLRKAPLLDRYNGPVLFEGRAAGEIFSGEFAPALTGRRKTLSGSPEMASMLGRFSEGGSAPFADKLGGRVLPQFLSVTDNPTISNYGNAPLFASYKVDQEGVRARETRVVENGVLKTFLTTRTPVEGVAHSSGNRRGPGPAPSNLILVAENGQTEAGLKQQFLELVKKRGLEYGIIIREIGSSGAGMEEQAMAMLSAMTGRGEKGRNVLLAYKAYLDGREELVRGARLSGMSADSFKEIVSASKSAAVYTVAQMPHFDFSMISSFAGGGMSAPLVSYVVPSLLFDDLTLAKPTSELPKPPFSSPPTAAQ